MTLVVVSSNLYGDAFAVVRSVDTERRRASIVVEMGYSPPRGHMVEVRFDGDGTDFRMRCEVTSSFLSDSKLVELTFHSLVRVGAEFVVFDNLMH